MPVNETIQQLLDEKYRYGNPWKLPKGAGFVLPILEGANSAERNYVLLQEVEGLVEFRDSGSISGVDALNKSGKNVFVRKGTMLSGQGTQSRSPVSGFVLAPSKEFVTLRVNCIHQSHYISTGASFEAGGVAPHSVYQALGEQGKTWQSVAGYARKMQSSLGGRPSGESGQMDSDSYLAVAEDNLVGLSAAVEKMKDTSEDVMKMIPGDHVDQVGIAVFDLEGVVGVEVFDHPDSWKAFSGSIVRSYSEVLTEELGELYEIRMDRAVPVLNAFLEKAKASEATLVTENRVSKIWALKGTRLEGELAEVEGREIHLVLARADEEKGGGVIPERLPPVATAPEGALDGILEEQVQENVQRRESFLTRRGGFSLLDSLSEGAQRFGELLGNVKASRGTLATRIKEAEDMGLVQKAIRKQNGSAAYALTEEGKKLKKEGDSKTV